MVGQTARDTKPEPAVVDWDALPDVREAVRLLYEQYGPRVRAFCRRRLGNSADADDAVQETFFKAQRGLHRFDRNAPVWPWLVTIAARVCTDIHRVHANELGDEIDLRATTGPEEHAARRARVAIVDEALRSMPDHYRTSLYMRHFEEWSYEDIARSQGTSIASIKSTLMRGRRQLGSRIESLARAERQWPLPSTLPVVARRIRDRVQRTYRDLGRVLQNAVGILDSVVSLGALAAHAPAAMVAVGALSTIATPIGGQVERPGVEATRVTIEAQRERAGVQVVTVGDGAATVSIGGAPGTSTYAPPFFSVRTPSPSVGPAGHVPPATVDAQGDDRGGVTVTVDLTVRTVSARQGCTDRPYITACTAAQTALTAAHDQGPEPPDPGPGVETTWDE